MLSRHSRQSAGSPEPFWDLRPHDRKVYSQFGEDGVIEYLSSVIPPVDPLAPLAPFAVEIGMWWGPGDETGGLECNTRALLEKPGWTILQIDGAAPADHPSVKRELVTAENIGEIFARYDVPATPALFSLDIDGMDYWVWKALPPRYRPQTVVIEYTAMFADIDTAKVVPYDPEYRWDGSSWTGASLGALVRLAREKGYALVHCTESNAFFVAAEHLAGHRLAPPQEIYSRRWGYFASPTPDPLGRAWVDCGSQLHLGRKLAFWWKRGLCRLHGRYSFHK